MATYTVRVEMHGASEQEYETLHHRMEQAGFSRTVLSRAGHTYRLPTAEYNILDGLDDAALFVQRVKAIVNTVRLGSWVLATKSLERQWDYS